MRISADLYPFRNQASIGLAKNEKSKTLNPVTTSQSMPSSEFYHDRLLSFGNATFDTRFAYNEGYKVLKAAMNNDAKFYKGIEIIDSLNKEIKELLKPDCKYRTSEEIKKHTIQFDRSISDYTDEVEDASYIDIFTYNFADNIKAIAGELWPQQHVFDMSLLAKSTNLNEEERKTVLDLWDNPYFHIAVQANPISDGLVKQLTQYKNMGFEIKPYLSKMVEKDILQFRNVRVEVHGPYWNSVEGYKSTVNILDKLKTD